MSTHALAPRFTADHVPHPIEAVIADAGRRSRGTAMDLTPVLLQYWQELPHVASDERRRWLAATRARVLDGETTIRAFVPYALGDIDEEIVCAATAEYVGAHPISIERRQVAVDEAVDWVRRGLALNRGAVFAALLSLGDTVIDETLAGLRLILTHAEIEVVVRHATARPSRAARTFLAEWLELLDSCEEPATLARELVVCAVATQKAQPELQ